MIEDKELRNLFKAESAEHLQNLEAGLLRLEKEPDNKSDLETAFRDAHSLKGAARMVGVTGVEKICHRIEDMLGKAVKESAPLHSEFMDWIYKALDSVKKLVREAVTGEPAGVDVSDVLNIMAGAEKNQATTENLPPASPPEDTSKTPYDVYRIDTIRVETKKLDELMTHTGELAVMKTRTARILAQVEEILESCESALNKSPMANGNGENFNPESEKIKTLVAKLTAMRDAIFEDNSRLEYIASALDGGIRDIRLVPFSALFNLFPRMVRDMAKERAKIVDLEIVGSDTKADKRIIEEMKDPIMHLIRNSIDHGIETPEERELAGKPKAGKIRLTAFNTEVNIVVEVADDGRGLNLDSIKKTALKRMVVSEKELEAMSQKEIENLVFEHGFSTSAFVTDVSGRGIGLDVVTSNLEALKGSVQVESQPGASCVFLMKLPVTLTTARVLLVAARGRSYAIPMEFVDTSLRVTPGNIFPLEGRSAIALENKTAVWVADLADILELPKAETVQNDPKPAIAWKPCVVLAVGSEKFGLFVDDLLDEQEVVLKPKNEILKRVRNVSDATILASGEICAVLNPNDMLRTVRKQSATDMRPPTDKKKEERKLSVLLVEDSITTRTQEKRILEGGGYEVVTAVNGLDALDKLAQRWFDAVVSDIMMPGMDGLALTATIRRDKKNKELPVILVTTLASDEDKRRGLEAGANAYIPKPSFDQKILLETLGRLV
jgi:two-component system chemotaxis sensor kinase CheA